jgi:hypothetical protein
MKSVPNLISYLHDFFSNFSQFLAIYFELFSYESKFNSEIADMRGPHVSRRFPRRVRLSDAVAAWLPRHPRALRALSGPRASVPTAHPPPLLSEPRCRLTSRALVPTAPSSVFGADRRCPSAPPSLSGRLHRRELFHGERNPSPLLPLFLPRNVEPSSSPSTPTQDRRRPPEPSPRRRTPPPIQFFSPSPSTSSSGELSPPPPCPAGSLSAVHARAPSFAPPPPL